MKRIVITVVFCCFFAAAAAQSSVSNIRVQAMDHVLVIQYDLSARADIEVHPSFDGGATFTGPLQHVTGEAGRGIEPGKDKIIIWNVRNEFGAMDNPNAVIKIVAANETGGAPRGATAPTVADGVAIISVGRKVYQFDRETNQNEFNRFMDLKVYKGMNELSGDQMQTLLARSDNFALPAYNHGVKNHVIGNWLLIPGAIPGIIVKSKGSTQITEAVQLYNNSINKNNVTQMMFDYNYSKGKKRNRIGNIFLWSGPLLAAGGWGLMKYDDAMYEKWYNDSERRQNDYYYSGIYDLGIVVASIGGGMILTGISLKINGKSLMKQPASLQNSANNRVGMELDFGLTGNGAGMALRF